MDIYNILSGGYITLKDILSDSIKKYGEAFNDRLFYEQLIFTDDIEDEAIDWTKDEITKDKIREYFKKAIKE